MLPSEHAVQTSSI